MLEQKEAIMVAARELNTLVGEKNSADDIQRLDQALDVLLPVWDKLVPFLVNDVMRLIDAYHQTKPIK